LHNKYFTGVTLYEKIVVVPKGSALVLQISSSRQGYESSFFFIDDSSDVLSEFSDYLPQVRAAHIKLPRKPAAVDHFPRAKFLEDCLPYVEEWLSE